MTSALEQTGFAATSAAFGRALHDTPWQAALRAEAAAIADRLAMPDPHRERPWKYLDITGFDVSPYRPGLAAPSRPAADTLRERFGLAGAAATLIQLNSETVLAEPAEGVTVRDFVDAPAIVEQHLGTLVAPGRSKLTALHYAFLRGGVLVEVAPNAEVAGHVRIVRSYDEGSQLATPHTLIVTGANSRVSIIEDFRSSDEEVFALPIVEIAPGPGSEVRYTVLHRWGANTRVFSEQRMLGERDSAFVGVSMVTGGRVVKVHQASSLEGRGSSSELYALCIGSDHQHVDFYTLQDHIGPDTRSDLLFKSALTDESRSVYYGLTRVGLHARNANANQENRNLLLSKRAKADSDPVLEILTSNIIRCSHGATVGPVDEEQLFYLQARGIPRPAAEALLVRGYLAQVLDRVPDDALRDELTTALEAKLEAR
jgi:Fe-S cluster assembly protein SufD